MQALTFEEMSSCPDVSHETIDKSLLGALVVQFACANGGWCLASTLCKHFKQHSLNKTYGSKWVKEQLRYVVAENFDQVKNEQGIQYGDCVLVLKPF